MDAETISLHVLSIGFDGRSGKEFVQPLERAGFSVERTVVSDDYLDRLSPRTDCVVCAHRPGDTDGLAVLRTVHEVYPDLPFVICVSDGSEAVASSAVEAGVSGYVPLDDGVPSDFPKRVRSAVETGHDQRERQDSSDVVHRRISDAFFAVDDEWRITHVNDSGAAILREAICSESDSAELLGRNLWEAVPEAVGTTFYDRYHEALATQEPVTFEEYYEPLDTRFELRVYPDEGGLSVYFTDVTDRRSRIRDLRRYQTLVETVGDPMYVLDAEGHIEMVNAAALEMFDADREDFVGTHASEFMAEGDFDRGTDLLRELRSTSGRDRATYEMTAMSTTGERIPAEVNVAPLNDESGEFRGSVGVIRDLSERKARESELAYRKALLEAQAETTVDGLLVIDDDRNVSYHNETFLDLWDIPKDVAADRSDERLLEYIRDNLADPAEYQAKVEYLYEHPKEESRDIIELADGRWLDRYSAPVVRDGVHYGRLWAFRDITARKTREQVLEEQRDELAQLHRLNTITREIARALQNTTTRTAIETAVCNHLTESGLYQTVWIGTCQHAPDGDPEIKPQTVVGVEEPYLDGIPQNEDGPGNTAIRSDEVQVVNDTARADNFPDERRDLALEHDHHALAAVPLTTGETTHGLLVVYPPWDHAITDRERDILADLGRIIALSIQRVNSQRSLTADSTVELQLQIPHGASPFGAVTRQLECELTFERWVPVDSDTGLQYLTVRNADPSRVCKALVRDPFVDAATPVRDSGEDTAGPELVEVRVADPSRSLINVLVEHGASITSARATDGTVHATAEIAPESDVRALVGAASEVADTVNLVSKRFVDRPITTVPEIKQLVSKLLTDKQEAVLNAAYVRGYHAWPRESTAEEIADTIDIASSTFHYHHRHAIRKLLTEFYE